MEGGKDFLQDTGLFTAGRIVGGLAGILLFSLLLSLILNKLRFNQSTFIVILIGATAMHLLVRGMIKRRWL